MGIDSMHVYIYIAIAIADLNELYRNENLEGVTHTILSRMLFITHTWCVIACALTLPLTVMLVRV